VTEGVLSALLRPSCPDSDPPDRVVDIRILVLQEPDEEEEEEEKKDDNDGEEDNDDDDGYSESMVK
jgi:hypothetical protein